MSAEKMQDVQYCQDTFVVIKDRLQIVNNSWDFSSPKFYIKSEDQNQCYIKMVGTYSNNYSYVYSVNISLHFEKEKKNTLQGITNLQATIWFYNAKKGHIFMLEKDPNENIYKGLDSVFQTSLVSSCPVTIKISYEKMHNDKLYLNYFNNFEKLLSSEEHADLKLKAANKTFNIHKCIISCRCPVLKKMIETNMIEKKTGLIDFSNWEAVVVKEMLAYIYTNTCEIAKIPHDLFRLAHFLELEELELKCNEYLQQNVNLKNIINTLELSCTDQYNLTELRNVANNFVSTHEAVLVKDLEFQDYLFNNIQTSNIQFILRLAKTHNLTEILTHAMEFLRLNYKEVLKNDECKEYLKTEPSLLLKMYEYSCEIYSAELVKMKNNNEESV